MASVDHVKQYIAHWLLLGKGIVFQNGRKILRPQSILRGGNYSSEFEQSWQEILAVDGQDCHLEGTETTLQELFSANWEIILCARCDMPIPLKQRGLPPQNCPCSDIVSWPNSELPKPKLPTNTQQHLQGLRDRLQQLGQTPPSCTLRFPPPDAPGLPYAMAVHLFKPYGMSPPPPPVESLAEHPMIKDPVDLSPGSC